MRKPCCEREGGIINKGAWSRQEDEKLINYIAVHGEGCWRAIPKAAGLLRCGKSCRLRWINYLRPDIKRGNFDLDEQDLIIKLHALLGNRWSLIAGRLPGRTDNEVKNYWNSHLKKKLIQMGIDPNNHKPQQHLPLIRTSHITDSNSSSMEGASNVQPNCDNNDNNIIGNTSSQANKSVGVNVGGGVSNMVVSCVDDDETSSSPLDLNLDLTISITPSSPTTQIPALDPGDSSEPIRVGNIEKAQVQTSPTLSLFR